MSCTPRLVYAGFPKVSYPSKLYYRVESFVVGQCPSKDLNNSIARIGKTSNPAGLDILDTIAKRLNEIIDEWGWPDDQIVGEDGAKAAWLIAQHAIGFPDLQRRSLRLLQSAADEGRVPRWQVAYLEDRIALHEGRPRRYGTQWLDDAVDGRIRPWKLADPEQVNELRAEVGLKSMPPIPGPGPELPPEQQRALHENQRWWEDWLVSKGWRK